MNKHANDAELRTIVPCSNTVDPNQLDSSLEEADKVLASLGASFAAEREAMLQLRKRLEGERFHLAVLGQFKRGKSTLLNALLGEEVLPTSVVPLTAVPTFLNSGAKRGVHVVYQNGQPEETFTCDTAKELSLHLERYVTEAANPANRLAVAQVEVYHPASILRSGVVLIDTPGIGSTFRHNTQATLNFLSQCDAALFVISADPPITEVEVEFLEQVRSKVPRLFFVLNKVDYLAKEERAVVSAFIRRVLQEEGGLTGEVLLFSVSALQALEARLSGNETMWQESGMQEIQNYLLDFLAREKMQTLRQAIAYKLCHLLEEVVMRLQMEIHSLKMPLHELEQRLRIFTEKLKEAESQRLSAQDSLAGDQKRILAQLEEEAQRLREFGRRYLNNALETYLEETGGDVPQEEVARARVAEAIPIFFEKELEEMVSSFQKRLQEVLEPHQRRADALIESVRRTAAELLAVPYRAPDPSEIVLKQRRPSWETYRWNATLSPIPEGFWDRLLPLRLRRARLAQRLRQQIEELVLCNVETVRWPMVQDINDNFRRFSRDLDQRLAATIASTRGAMEIALERRRLHEASCAEEVARLEAAAAQLRQIIEALGVSGWQTTSAPVAGANCTRTESGALSVTSTSASILPGRITLSA